MTKQRVEDTQYFFYMFFPFQPLCVATCRVSPSPHQPSAPSDGQAGLANPWLYLELHGFCLPPPGQTEYFQTLVAVVLGSGAKLLASRMVLQFPALPSNLQASSRKLDARLQAPSALLLMPKMMELKVAARTLAVQMLLVSSALLLMRKAAELKQVA